MSLSILDTITIIAIVPLIVFAFFFLIERSKKEHSNFYLGLFLLILGLFTLNYFLLGFRKVLPPFFSYVFSLGGSLYFILGPSLYTYCKSVFSKNISFRSEILHYLPFIFSTLYYIFVYNSYSEVFYLIRYSQIFIYILLSFKIFREYKEKLKQDYSNINSIEVIRFSVVLLFFIVLWLIDVIALGNFLFFDFSKTVNSILAYFSMTITFLLPYFIIYHTLRYPVIEHLSNNSSSDNNTKILEISEEEIDSHLIKLNSYLDSTKAYQKSNLTLKELANEINISPRLLSKIINSRLDKTFFDLINGLRIEEAKRLLSSKTNGKSILEICFESGFNSKSAFNSTFKKYVGTTPSKFKNSVKKSAVT